MKITPHEAIEKKVAFLLKQVIKIANYLEQTRPVPETKTSEKPVEDPTIQEQRKQEKRIRMEPIVNEILLKKADPASYKFIPFTAEKRVKCGAYKCQNPARWIIDGTEAGRHRGTVYCSECKDSIPAQEVESYAQWAEDGNWYMFPDPYVWRKRQRKKVGGVNL